MAEMAMAIPMAAEKPQHPLSLPYFRNLLIGQTISLLGDQFYLVALPWLVLQLTGSSLALGTILMTAAIPRATLMLIGGAVTDRVSARRVLISTALARTALVGTVAALVWLHAARLWELYTITFAFGVADAFSFPAGSALLPTILKPTQLQSANSIVQSSTLITQMAGPAPAGLIVRAWGMASGLFFDALSFLGLIAALFKFPDPVKATAVSVAAGTSAGAPAAPKRPPMWHSIMEGLRAVNNDLPLRSLLLVQSAMNICIAGPIAVGLAALAKFRFGSAAAFGTFLSCFSGGVLAGILLGGLVKRPAQPAGSPAEARAPGSFHIGKLGRGMQFILMGLLCGIEMIVIGLVPKFFSVAGLLAVMGLGVGFVSVQFSTWLQTRVDRALLGRVMSVLMFSAVGLIPVSYAVAGVLAQWSVTGMFVVAGASVVVVCTVAFGSKAAREIQ